MCVCVVIITIFYYFFFPEGCRREVFQHPWGAGVWGGGGGACGGKRDRFWLGLFVFFYYAAAKQSEMLADFKTS